ALGSCFEEGKGPHIFDFTEWWKFCRAYHDLPNDPTGWFLTNIYLLVEDTLATPGAILTNSYLSIARRKYEPPPYDDYPIQVYPALEDEIKHRAHYVMYPVQLLSGGHYALVIRHKDQWPPMPADIMYDKGDATYPVGHKSHSDDRGETWTNDDDDDVCFAAYGTPPTPTAPPAAPAGNIAFLDIKQTITATGYEIVVITDVPCHVYMMWTNKEPNKHKIVGLRRGDLALRETRVCFVSWHKNEQEEAGDTLTHTFIKEPWPVCETRWFTFRAEVQSLWSASSSPIFKKHRPSPPTTQDFYPDPHPEVSSFDGFSLAGRTYLTWAQLRARPALLWYDTGSYMYVLVKGTSQVDKWYEIDRSLPLFDTSEIEPGSTILSATLKLYLDCPYCQLPGFAINIYSSDPLLNTALSQEDHLSLGSIPFSTKLELTEVF
ncbi:unnamed protein product, partial [marine sediment metagenome]